VVFTAAMVDGSTPNGLTWQWTPDPAATGTTEACAKYVNPCATRVNGPGTMTARATTYPTYIQGNWGATAHVDADTVNCPSQDSLLNDPGVRREFMRLDSLANPSGPESTRQEHVAALTLDSLGNLHVLDIPTVPVTNNCRSSWPIPTPQTLFGERLIAIIHVHPYAVGEEIHCMGGQAGLLLPGGSPDYDWPTMRAVNNSSAFVAAGWHVPFYIIDSHNVYRMDPDGSPGSDRDPVAVWNGGTCDWIE
jgi:hypothetical protein